MPAAEAHKVNHTKPPKPTKGLFPLRTSFYIILPIKRIV